MKTITRKSTNVSLYLFNDDVVVDVKSNEIVIGNPPEFIIGDCDSSNAVLFENVSNPEDWQGWKYLYTESGGWVLNPDWIDPNASQ